MTLSMTSRRTESSMLVTSTSSIVNASADDATATRSTTTSSTMKTASLPPTPTVSGETTTAIRTFDSHAKDTVFESFGILEHVLSYVSAKDLVAATEVNVRWKQAGRADYLWKHAVEALWETKLGVQAELPLFWRSLFTKEAIRRMTASQIRSIFHHPLLTEKMDLLEKCVEKSELQRFLQVHMLDVMSDGPDWHHFFSDVYFGSYACSVLDSKRSTITPLELCTPHGFDMYFKIAQDEVEDADRTLLTVYDEAEGILLYHHSTCYFEDSRDFSIVLKQYVHSYHPTDLKWRWLDVGKRLQVGPYPPLTITRRKDWGWKLENLHVVLLFRDEK